MVKCVRLCGLLGPAQESSRGSRRLAIHPRFLWWIVDELLEQISELGVTWNMRIIR